MSHGSRPDPTEVKERLLASRVSQGVVQDECQPDRAVDLGPDPVVEERTRPAMRKIRCGSEASAVQGNRHAFTGKGWDDAGLIAQTK